MKKLLLSTKFLINGLLALTGITLFGGILLLDWIFKGNIPNVYQIWVVVISGFFMTAYFVFVVIRREMPRPGLPSTVGGIAIFWGILGVLLCGGGTFYLLISILTGAIK
jgi:hypothetical protein